MGSKSSGLRKLGAQVRFYLALFAAWLAALGCRIFGYPGTSLPGVVALRICPQVVAKLAPAYEKVFAVTGTNGKTTTANLLAHFLRAAGYTVAHNAEGANMLSGVAAALVRDCDWRGKPHSRAALLEVDEGSVRKIFPVAKPDMVVVTNYFSDQMDRYCELESTIGLLRAAIADIPGVTLVLNADDPLVAGVGKHQDGVIYFGVNQKEEAAAFSIDYAGKDCRGDAGPASGETREGRYCTFCRAELVYRYYHYGQLGDFYCPGCGFRRPKLDYTASDVTEEERLSFSVSVKQPEQMVLTASLPSPSGSAAASSSPDVAFTEAAGESAPVNGGTSVFTTSLRGFYNVYNIIAATAATSANGISLDLIKRSLLDFKPAPGRMDEFILRGRPCTLALIKNPAGINEVLKTILTTERDKSLVIAINDLAADGRDVSWLWDTGFDRLSGERIKKIICSGLRAADLAVCLKYTGIEADKLILTPECEASLEMLAAQEGDELYVLANYTILLDYARLLKREAKSA